MAENTYLRTVSTPKYEDYKKQFAHVLMMERKNGILQLTMHTDGKHVLWSPRMHHSLLEAWSVIGLDTENEVLIITAAGPYWISQELEDMKDFSGWDDASNSTLDTRYQGLYRATKSVENFINGFDIPTIAVIPGPGCVHSTFALFCDITLCAPDFVFEDNHFPLGHVPGDGLGLLLQGLAGIKRGAYMMYTGNGIDAKTMLDWGIVNEVLPREKLLPRAWEIAEDIMKQPRAVRRATHALTVRPFKRLLMDDFTVHRVHQQYASQMLRTPHDFVTGRKRWEEEKKKKKQQQK